jgi:hypothetical protein
MDGWDDWNDWDGLRDIMDLRRQRPLRSFPERLRLDTDLRKASGAYREACHIRPKPALCVSGQRHIRKLQRKELKGETKGWHCEREP